MKVFIIGATGFVGKHLIDHLRDDRKWSVIASKLPHEYLGVNVQESVDLDVLNRDAVLDVLRTIDPDYIFYLAAQSSVMLSWKEPELTVDINIKGALNLLESIRQLDKKPRTLLIGSGEEYGHVLPEEIPIREENILRPGNIYAVTKVCQGMLGKIYSDAYDLDIMVVRAFTHVGPGQSPAFVVSDFCKQVAEIEAGLREPIIRVGNLSAKRDFTDVRDIVRAYGLLMDYGSKGQYYNVGTGKSISINDILKMILNMSTAKITVEVDKSKFRPVDVSNIEADITNLQDGTGWQPTYLLQETVEDVLEYWRNISK